jgi:hypothetical protein
MSVQEGDCIDDLGEDVEDYENDGSSVDELDDDSESEEGGYEMWRAVDETVGDSGETNTVKEIVDAAVDSVDKNQM